MSESDRTGYRESPDTSDGPPGMVDGTPGNDPSDRGELDTEGGAQLTTDDDAQADDGPARPGNAAD